MTKTKFSINGLVGKTIVHRIENSLHTETFKILIGVVLSVDKPEIFQTRYEIHFQEEDGRIHLVKVSFEQIQELYKQFS